MRPFDDPKDTPLHSNSQGRHILVLNRDSDNWVPLSEAVSEVIARLRREMQ